MLKKEIRKQYRAQRLALPVSQATKLDDLLLIQFQSAELPFLTHLLSYWPIEENNEPDTHAITGFLRFRNPELKIAYPVSDFTTGTMTAMAVDIDTAFTRQELNIYEPRDGQPVAPEDLDLVIVPLLAFDSRGYRVGYGKGFYDRYLAACRSDCIRVGLSYFGPLEAIDDVDEFDVPLSLCITPQQVYVF